MPRLDELLPAPPEGVSIQAQFLTCKDFDFATFFRATDKGLFLAPEIIEDFDALLPILRWVAESVTRLISERKKMEALPPSPESLKQERELDQAIHNFALLLQAQIPSAIKDKQDGEMILIRDLPTDDVSRIDAYLLALEIPYKEGDNEEEKNIKNVTKITFNILDSLGVLPKQNEIARQTRINSGQLSAFVSKGGSIGLEKSRQLLLYCLEIAEKKSCLRQLLLSMKRRPSIL